MTAQKNASAVVAKTIDPNMNHNNHPLKPNTENTDEVFVVLMLMIVGVDETLDVVGSGESEDVAS